MSNGPTAIHTKLGWVLPDPTCSKELDHCSVKLVTTHILRVDTQQNESKYLDDRLQLFWDLESVSLGPRVCLSGTWNLLVFVSLRNYV